MNASLIAAQAMTIPLIADLEDLRPSVRSLVRACAAAAIAAYDGIPSMQVVRREWANDSGAHYLLRAPSAPADASSASALVRTVMPDLMTALAPQTAAARIFQEGLQLNFGRDGQISVPTLLGDPSLAAFVAEGWPIPVVQPGIEPLITLTPHKLACIVVLTTEMVRSSNLEALISDALFRSVAMTLDSVLLDDQPASVARPAGLRYGVTPITADASPDPTWALMADISNLYLAVASTATRPPIYVNSLARTALAELSAPHGLQPLIPVIGSYALRGTTDMIAIAPNVLACVLGTVPEIQASRETALQMESVPTDLISGPTRSTFQTDCIAIKLRLPVTWGLRANVGVAWLSATHW